MLDFQIGEGWDALDAEVLRDRLDGFAVVSGAGVSAGSGLSVDVASGEVALGYDGNDVVTQSVSATTLSLDTADSTDPRKDTIYVDGTGTPQVEVGTPAPAAPSVGTQFDTYDPAPPLPSSDHVVLAQVWVAAGASDVVSADIRDMRVPAQGVVETLRAKSATIDSEPTADRDAVRRTEIRSALTYEPEPEPATPSDGVTRWYDSNDDAFKAKFSDGSTVTIAEV